MKPNLNKRKATPIKVNHEFEEMMAKVRQDLSYKAAYLGEKISDDLWRAMESRSLSERDLARRAGISRKTLTKVFKGGDCTLATLTKLIFALQCRLEIRLTANTDPLAPQ